MVEYALKVNATTWIESNYEEILGVWTFAPDLVFRATYKGMDVTGEVLETMRTKYIYG